MSTLFRGVYLTHKGVPHQLGTFVARNGEELGIAWRRAYAEIDPELLQLGGRVVVYRAAKPGARRVN
jgi:hypothetical protein